MEPRERQAGWGARRGAAQLSSGGGQGLWNPRKKDTPSPIWRHPCQARTPVQLPNLLGVPGTSTHLSLPSRRAGNTHSSPWSWDEGMGRRPAMWPAQASPVGDAEGHEACFLARTRSVNAGVPSSPGKPRSPPPLLCCASVSFSGSTPRCTLTSKQHLYTPHSLPWYLLQSCDF